MGGATAFGAVLMLFAFGYLFWTPPDPPPQVGQQTSQHSDGPYADWASRQVGKVIKPLPLMR